MLRPADSATAFGRAEGASRASFFRGAEAPRFHRSQKRRAKTPASRPSAALRASRRCKSPPLECKGWGTHHASAQNPRAEDPGPGAWIETLGTGPALPPERQIQERRPKPFASSLPSRRLSGQAGSRGARCHRGSEAAATKTQIRRGIPASAGKAA